jgi:hypothetical protein
MRIAFSLGKATQSIPDERASLLYLDYKGTGLFTEATSYGTVVRAPGGPSAASNAAAATDPGSIVSDAASSCLVGPIATLSVLGDVGDDDTSVFKQHKGGMVGAPFGAGGSGMRQDSGYFFSSGRSLGRDGMIVLAVFPATSS